MERMKRKLQNVTEEGQWRAPPMTFQADFVLDNTLAGILVVLSQVFLVWSRKTPAPGRASDNTSARALNAHGD